MLVRFPNCRKAAEAFLDNHPDATGLRIEVGGGVGPPCLSVTIRFGDWATLVYLDERDEQNPHRLVTIFNRTADYVEAHRPQPRPGHGRPSWLRDGRRPALAGR